MLTSYLKAFPFRSALLPDKLVLLYSILKMNAQQIQTGRQSLNFDRMPPYTFVKDLLSFKIKTLHILPGIRVGQIEI